MAITGHFGLCSMFPRFPSTLAHSRCRPIDAERYGVKANRGGGIRRSAVCDAAAEARLGAVRESDADFGTLAPHHAAMALASAVGEMQHEDIGQIGTADVEQGAAIGHVGGDAIERRVGLR